MREGPVQRYSKVVWVAARGLGFPVEDDFKLTFSFLVKMEDCRHWFCSPEL